jgi:hypothetical protein
MSKPPRRANYHRKLARVLVLADGTKLVTPRDAANVLRQVFASVNARSGASRPRDPLAIDSGKTGKRADMAATGAIDACCGRGGYCDWRGMAQASR